MTKPIYIWTDADLDGACSYLLMRWIYKNPKLEVKPTTITNFAKDFEGWYNDRGVRYDKVYILDLDIHEYIEMVDKPNVVIIDHHETHLPFLDKYKHATKLIENCDSCSKLIYKTFKSKLEHLTASQKLLIGMVNDYDCYRLVLPHSLDLNKVYWSYTGNKTDKFCTDFNDGFIKFNDQHEFMLELYESGLNDCIKDIPVFTAETKLQGKSTKIVVSQCDEYINDVSVYLLDTYKCDVSIIVNLETHRVYFRRAKGCEIDVSQLAIKLCDGGGHTAAAGGTLTEKFANFSKIFSQVK